MSVLLFVEHSVEVAQGKTSCKTSKSGYLRIGKTHGGGGEGEVGIEEEGARILAGVDRLRWEVLPLPPAGQPLAGPAPSAGLGISSAGGAAPPVPSPSCRYWQHRGALLCKPRQHLEVSAHPRTPRSSSVAITKTKSQLLFGVQALATATP